MRSSSVGSLGFSHLLLGAAAALGACAIEAPEVGTDEPEAQVTGSLLDASLSGEAARDGGRPAPAGDAGTDPCGPGRVTCGATCIDAIAPTAEALQDRVFGRSCGLSRSCHGGAAPQASLNLDSLDALFDRVVGKPALEVPSLALIAPGQPEASYVVQKLRNTHGKVGTVMPPSAPLCEPKIQAVEAWIRAGASR